jgi:hypothetical protein
MTATTISVGRILEPREIIRGACGLVANKVTVPVEYAGDERALDEKVPSGIIREWLVVCADFTYPESDLCAMALDEFAANHLEVPAQAIADRINVCGCAIVMWDLFLPGGIHWSERVSDPGTGIRLRLAKAYDMGNDRMITRLSAMFLPLVKA